MNLKTYMKLKSSSNHSIVERMFSLFAYNVFRFQYYLQFNLQKKINVSNNTDTDPIRYWNERALQYSSQYGNTHRMRFLEKILSTNRSNIKTVLELGCGNGINLKCLGYAFPDVMFAGLDLSPIMVRIANENVANLQNVKVFCANLEQIDLVALDMYDLVFSRTTLQHINPVATRNIITYLFENITDKFYLEENHIRGFKDGRMLRWPTFPDGMFFNHDYISILRKHAHIRYEKYKTNNILLCLALKNGRE